MKYLTPLVKLANIFELLGIMLVLLLAMTLQFYLHELPCPLCMLQRIGFLGIGFGFLLNLRFGFRPSHYAITLFSAIFSSLVALRQIALHVIPGTGAYGSPFLGLHLYTWVFILSFLIIIFSTLLLSVDRQYKQVRNVKNTWVNLLFILMSLVIFSNILSTLFECGLHLECPDNPVQYELLKGI